MNGREENKKRKKNIVYLIVFFFVVFIMLFIINYCNTHLKEYNSSETTTETISEMEETSESVLKDDKDDSNLSHEKKLEIYDYIETEEEKYGEYITDEETDKIWEKAEKLFNISENDIYEIMSDTDLIKEYYSGSRSNEYTDNYAVEYDAVLSNSGYGVVVAVSKNAMDEYINALSTNNNSTIQSLYSLGYIAKISEGTKVDVIETGISMSKVRILEGTYEGLDFYSINECIDLK